MSSKFFDIPFRSKSSDSDFICKDGEIESVSGAWLKTGNDQVNDDLNPGTPPRPDISFALVRDTLKGWHINPDNYPSKTLAASDPSMEYWTNLGAQLLNLFQSEASSQNLFVAPFYVAAAWRTNIDTCLSPTVPVLMIPNSEVPLVTTDTDINKTELELRIAGAVCSLYMKMIAPEALRDWVGKITSLDIFVSEPLQSYNSFLSFIPQHRLNSDSLCRCLDMDTGLISARRICTETLPLAWKGVPYNSRAPYNSIKREGLRYYRLANIPLSEVDLMEKWSPLSGSFFWDSDSYNGNSVSGWTYDEIANSAKIPEKSQLAVIEGKGDIIDITTRPLKLSGAALLKHFSFVRLRGNYDPAVLTISVYASRDMLDWWCVAKKKGGSVAGLPLTSFRFFKVRIQGLLNEGENLQGITID